MARRFSSLVLVFLTTGCALHQDGAATLRDLVAFRQIVRQRFETTCGAASLATLMTYYFRQPTSEDDILQLIVPDGKAPDRGLSVDDLKRAATLRGYRVASHQIELSLLRGLPEPAVVVLCPSAQCPPGKFHFSVFQGTTGDAIQLADPSRGRVVMGQAAFARIWPGLILILGKDVVKNPSFFLKATGPAASDVERRSASSSRLAPRLTFAPQTPAM